MFIIPVQVERKKNNDSYLVAREWKIRKIVKEFHAPEPPVKQAKKFLKQKGILSTTTQRPVKKITYRDIEWSYSVLWEWHNKSTSFRHQRLYFSEK